MVEVWACSSVQVAPFCWPRSFPNIPPHPLFRPALSLPHVIVPESPVADATSLTGSAVAQAGLCDADFDQHDCTATCLILRTCAISDCGVTGSYEVNGWAGVSRHLPASLLHTTLHRPRTLSYADLFSESEFAPLRHDCPYPTVEEMRVREDVYNQQQRRHDRAVSRRTDVLWGLVAHLLPLLLLRGGRDDSDVQPTASAPTRGAACAPG
jgi:hypothetical protein